MVAVDAAVPPRTSAYALVGERHDLRHDARLAMDQEHVGVSGRNALSLLVELAHVGCGAVVGLLNGAASECVVGIRAKVPVHVY